MPKYPQQYTSISKRYQGIIKALEGLGKATKAAGPLNKKTSELIQLAAAAAIRAEVRCTPMRAGRWKRGLSPQRSSMR